METQIQKINYAHIALDQAHGGSRGGYSHWDGLRAEWDEVQKLLGDPEIGVSYAQMLDDEFVWERLIRLGLRAGLVDKGYCTPSSGEYYQIAGRAVIEAPFWGRIEIEGKDRATKGCPIVWRCID
jgi:hypothetical protein